VRVPLGVGGVPVVHVRIHKPERRQVQLSSHGPHPR
jgi:hypothetical protein